MTLLAGGAAAMSLPQLLRRAGAASADERPPNVLVIQPDQHRGTIMRCAGGSQALTPNLDRLAAGGIRFAKCASSSPVCCPFRGSMQTGLYPHKHGVLSNDKYRLDPKCPTFAEVFAKAGYATGYIGKWHLDSGTPKKEGGEGVTPKAVGGFVPPERRRGWQEWNGYEKSHEYFEVWTYNEEAKKVRVKGYDWEPTWFTDKALDFAKRHRDDGKPWLYYIAFGPPHVPEECPDRFLKLFDPAKFVLPPDVLRDLSSEKQEELRKEFQMYYALVNAIDVEIGRLLDGLKELGVDDNTVILYTSDHGDILGSHAAQKGKLRGKAQPYANAFRIPLIIRWPKKIKPNQVCDALVSSVDLAPTLVDLAGLPPIPGAQGQSMASWGLNGNGPRNPGVWIGLGSWRAAWDGRFTYSPGAYDILYDHQTDPYEMKNVIDSPEYAAEKKRMQDLLVSLAEKNGDPMLEELKNPQLLKRARGTAPAPEGEEGEGASMAAPGAASSPAGKKKGKPGRKKSRK